MAAESFQQKTFSELGESETPVSAGQIYGDERHSEVQDGEKVFLQTFEVVFVDENRVLMRICDCDDEYRHERIEPFLENRGVRWKLLEEGDEDATMASLPQFHPVIALLKGHRDDLELQGGQKEGHIAEGIQYAVDFLKAFEPEECDWKQADNVGPATADNLRDAGYRTDVDVQIATDEELLEIPGVGEKSISGLRQLIADAE